jgi:hypothetical protein
MAEGAMAEGAAEAEAEAEAEAGEGAEEEEEEAAEDNFHSQEKGQENIHPHPPL